MSTEVKSSNYYIMRSYAPVYYYIYMTLEDWIAKNVFRNDLSRVFLASDNYVFRRRFELTDMSTNYNNLEVSSLNFPFANYWPQNSGWQPDDRVAGKSSALTYIGIDAGQTKLKAAGGILNIPTTFYFDREDDARLAYEILYFYTFNKHNYSTTVPYANHTLDVPVSIELEALQFNPQFKESDWLKKQRIFPIKVNFRIYSYAIVPPYQPDYNVTVNPDGTLSDGTGPYNDGTEHNYLSEKVLLKMYNYDDLFTSNVTVKGIVDEGAIKIDRFYVKEKTSNRATIAWEYENQDITRIKLYTGVSFKYVEIDPRSKKHTLVGLTPESRYDIYVEFYNSQGASKKLGLFFTTEMDPDVIKIKKDNQIIADREKRVKPTE